MVRSIHGALQDIRNGLLSPVALLEQCLKGIEAYEARIRAWVVVDRQGAKAQAERAAEEIRGGNYRGPLHGIPIGIKDIIDVADLPTAAGYRPWAQNVARRDATVVARLREAGAVILGKLSTTQFASFDPSPTRNPWNISRTPGGSSSGSAAAVACGMCFAALGSQTGGSITRPASYCGVPACKPTYGRVSVDGVLPLAPSMDHVGPMATCVRDLATVLQAIAGPDPWGPGSSLRPVPNYLAHIDRESQPPRLGRLRGLFDERAEPCMHEMMDSTCDKLASQGAAICERALPAAFSEVIPRHRTVMAVEAAAYHKERLARTPEEYGPNITSLLTEGLACSAVDYARCKEHQAELSRAMGACFEDVDALIMPATTGPAPDIKATGDPAFNSPWSYTGLPVVSIPAGWTADRMPLAIQLVGPRFGESELLAVAAWCESTLGLESVEPPIK
jgi:aspartyl-tRNA(Asn)/glutamyl-tRNA(Gln) amidotransferase subunit A